MLSGRELKRVLRYQNKRRDAIFATINKRILIAKKEQHFRQAQDKSPAAILGQTIRTTHTKKWHWALQECLLAKARCSNVFLIAISLIANKN